MLYIAGAVVGLIAFVVGFVAGSKFTFRYIEARGLMLKPTPPTVARR